MTFEQLEKASKKELRNEALDRFNRYNESAPGGVECLWEAQFFMQELDRRKSAWIATRDLWLAVVMILLICLQLVLAFIGIREGNKQTQVLNNLQTSTAATAATLKEQLAMQYRVFVGATYGGGTLHLFNNSKAEIYLCGLKVGNNPALAIGSAPTSVAEHMEMPIVLERYYPRIYDRVQTFAPAPLPRSVYLKNATGEEFVLKGKLPIMRAIINLTNHVQTGRI
jgi:hypothetical protein